MSESPPTVREMTPGDATAWDAFVQASPQATFFHRAGWREVIQRAFHLPAHFLLAEDALGIRGVLPLVEVKSWLFGHALVSTPFCVYGGAAAADEAAGRALVAAALRRAEQLGVASLELRNLLPEQPPGAGPQQAGSRWHGRTLHATFRQPLAATPEAQLAAIPRKQRAEVRKGMQGGLAAVEDASPERCYRLYAESLHQLGTPLFTRRYFPLLREVFGADCHILTVESGGRAVGSVLSFFFRDQVLPYYAGAVPEGARPPGVYPYLYWRLMNLAAQRGAKIFDFGRSKQGSGSYAFKEHFGFTAEPLPYVCWLARGEEVPQVHPANPKYQRAIRLWRRLPLAATLLIGPPLARKLG
ncbi:MAG: FemAB family PEP-CTERM system-associated protein [Magnetococcales bacterium]|nr:FemAB family PEP-CTERM system-associated protein [Magnetococcales bacterium]